MKRNPSVTNHKNSEKYSDKFLSWEELFEKGTLLRNTIKQLSLTPGAFYSVTKSCTDGTFQAGDVITLEANHDLFCPKTGKRITPGQCTKENMDFLCVPAGDDIH